MTTPHSPYPVLARGELVDEIAAFFGLPPGGTLTYRGLWDLDAGNRRICFGSAHPGPNHVPVPMLDRLDPSAPDVGPLACKVVLLWIEARRIGAIRKDPRS